MYYIEYKGNTYYAYENRFKIDDVEYTWDGFTVTINDKIYIENGKLTVNGITYTTMINREGQLVVYDLVGNVYNYSNWNTEHVSYNPTYVEKLVIGDNTQNIIDCESITSYGHRAYIIYNDQKYYIQYFYSGTYKPKGAGVMINGTQCICDAICIETPKDSGRYVGIYGDDYNIYNINDYGHVYDSDNVTMTIDDEDYIIHFEPCEIPECGIVGIETTDEYPSVLIGDRLTIKVAGYNYEARVNFDGNDNTSYVYINGRRHDVINHLCDSITFGNEKCILEYVDDLADFPEEFSTASAATCELSDGTVLYFAVKADDESALMATRMLYDNGKWDTFTSMISTGDTVEYRSSPPLPVEECDGVLVGTQKLPISKHYVVSTDYTGTTASDSVIDDTYYKCVFVTTPLEYNFKVINTVGSNRILCVPDVNPAIYSPSGVTDLSSEIISAIQDNDNFLVLKRSNSFGVTDLYYDTWANDAYQMSVITKGTSVYELADVKNNIRLFTKSSSYTIPLTLSSNTSYKLAYEDLIVNQYYNDEVTKAVNPLVDMEKDMYTPVILRSGTYQHVDSMIFNLHFRTRDMETWKIIEDRGRFDGVEQSANFQYCNYFVTDYYPYNKYIEEKKSDEHKLWSLFKTSDLLGFLYFTTDDVKTKREKLSKSFLRLTFFDSMNPENQNMLGTSTLHFDCDRYFDTLYQPSDKYHYELTAKSQNADRQQGSSTGSTADAIDWDVNNPPTVLTECFEKTNDSSIPATAQLHLGFTDNTRLDSSIIVNDSPQQSKASEGYYTYILKEFADQNGLDKPKIEGDTTSFPTKDIYMKVEFFHAGLGLKIPMILPTYWNGEGNNKGYYPITNWTDRLDDFKKGYDLDSVLQRMYIPLTIQYSPSLKKYVYYFQNGYPGYGSAIVSGNNLTFNLFELKIKPNITINITDNGNDN